MPVTLRNSDLVLAVRDDSTAVLDVVNKYDAFLAALCDDHYAFQRGAIRVALTFLVSTRYANTRDLATENFDSNERLQGHYGSLAQLLERIPLADRKAVSVELATGTGKSYVIYGLARILLAEGLVDKVLVLCPSLTIEEGLKDKFHILGADPNLNAIMEELGAVWRSPEIKSANDPIEPGDICVENIHAVYERTGSSIMDSFGGGKGARTLVLNDEAHHIFSGVDTATRRWLEFLQNPEFSFRYIVNSTGTPYTKDDYFPDVVFRYGLKQAIDNHVVKQIDYKLEDLVGRDAGYEVTYQNHVLNRDKYGTKLRPITIVVTEKIAACVMVWKELTEFIASKEQISIEEARKKVIWVASGIPSGRDGEIVKSIVEQPEKVRRKNITLLKDVDSPDSQVEWIVSVSMLTEGWDVKNVFQIVPHENRAFNSKLLIAQVLGRGLRIPPGITGEVAVKINNHERWTPAIEKLYRDILEIENRLTWGWLEQHKDYAFPLYNLKYSTQQQTIETKTGKAIPPKAPLGYEQQSKEWLETSTYARTGQVSTLIEDRNILAIDTAVKRMKIFLNDADPVIAKQWTTQKLKSLMVDSLKAIGAESDYISLNNFYKTQQAFGPLFRQTGQSVPRYTMQPDALYCIQPEILHRQSFSEDSLCSNMHVFYSDTSTDGITDVDEKALWAEWMKTQKYIAAGDEVMLSEDKREIARRLKYVEAKKFKTPWNLLVSASEPERKFLESFFVYTDEFDSIIKSSDKGFYSFPYTYKPATRAKTHPKSENFNPDFFLKLKDRQEILVVETKKDGDDSNKNRAKLRDGRKHFADLNGYLNSENKGWQYHFYFLSTQNIQDFFEAVRNCRYKGWVSDLMSELGR